MKKKILHVLASTPIGGVGTYLINLFSNIKNDDYIFSVVVCDSQKESLFENKLNSLGIKLFYAPKIKMENFKIIKKWFFEFFDKNEDYDIVEIHAPNMTFLCFDAIKKCTTSKIVIHFHNTKLSTNPIKAMRNYFLESKFIKAADYYVSCGDLVSKTMESTFKLNPKKMFIVKNGTKIIKNDFSKEELEVLKTELGVNGKNICLAVGNCLPQKNYGFLLKISKYLDNKTVVLVAGGGSKLHSFILKCKRKRISNIMFLGIRDDVPKLMSISNALVMPSLHEGLPLVAVESQVYGLPALISDRVSHELKINDNVYFLPLELGPEKWAKEIEKTLLLPKCGIDKIEISEFNIMNSVRKVLKIYSIICGKDR